MLDKYRQWRQHRYDVRYFKKWDSEGRKSAAPYFVKQQTIGEFARKTSIQYFIETGTLYGDMIRYATSLGIFKRIYSVELSDFYFQRAKRRFRNDANVEIRHGDSGQVVPKLLTELDQPILFWLDGHYSGSNTATLEDTETPVSNELAAVFAHASRLGIDHVILIDDARCFDGTKGYPRVSTLKEEIELHYPKYSVEVKDDIIRVFCR